MGHLSLVCGTFVVGPSGVGAEVWQGGGGEQDEGDTQKCSINSSRVVDG